MSVVDYGKIKISTNYKIFSIKQLKKVVKTIEKQLKNTNFGCFECDLIVSYDDRNSDDSLLK